MAVAYDNSVSVTGSMVSSVTTASFTISGSDRAFVNVLGWNQSGITATASDCGGASGASAGTRAANGNTIVHLWKGVAPATGSQTASATWDDSFANVVLAAHTFTGVDQTTPTADHTTATGATTAISVTVPNTVAGGMVVDGARTPGGGTMTAGANQTERIDLGSVIATSTQDGADGGVMSWTQQFDTDWAQAAVRLIAAAAGGAVGWGLLLGGSRNRLVYQ